MKTREGGGDWGRMIYGQKYFSAGGGGKGAEREGGDERCGGASVSI